METQQMKAQARDEKIRRQLERSKLAREKLLREEAEKDKRALEQQLAQFQEETRIAQDALRRAEETAELLAEKARLAEEEAMLLSQKAAESEAEIQRIKINAIRSEEEKMQMERKASEAELLATTMVEESERRAKESAALREQLLRSRLIDKDSKDKYMSLFRMSSLSSPIDQMTNGMNSVVALTGADMDCHSTGYSPSSSMLNRASIMHQISASNASPMHLSGHSPNAQRYTSSNMLPLSTSTGSLIQSASGVSCSNNPLRSTSTLSSSHYNAFSNSMACTQSGETLDASGNIAAISSAASIPDASASMSMMEPPFRTLPMSHEHFKSVSSSCMDPTNLYLSHFIDSRHELRPDSATVQYVKRAIESPLAVLTSCDALSDADVRSLAMEIEKGRLEYLEKSRHFQEQLRGLRNEIEVLKVEDRLSIYDRLYEENVRRGENKYSTLRKTKSGSTRARVAFFEEL
jgi:hypothetical protein